MTGSRPRIKIIVESLFPLLLPGGRETHPVAKQRLFHLIYAAIGVKGALSLDPPVRAASLQLMQFIALILGAVNIILGVVNIPLRQTVGLARAVRVAHRGDDEREFVPVDPGSVDIERAAVGLGQTARVVDGDPDSAVLAAVVVVAEADPGLGGVGGVDKEEDPEEERW